MVMVDSLLRMITSHWIPNWPLRVQIFLCLVCVKAIGPTIMADVNTTRSQVMLLHNDDFLVGFGNDPFGERLQAIVAPQTSRKSRGKRSVVHLYNMVGCATGCNPLAYKGYGCYCGFLGSGYTVDGIDRCCQMHDWCYNSSGCPMFLEYFVPYVWKCFHRQPYCGVKKGKPNVCSQRLCHCDQLLAQCLQQYPCPTTKALCTSSPWRLLQNVFML